MVADHALRDSPDDDRIPLRVDALAAHQLAHVEVELVDQLRVGIGGQRHGGPCPE